MTDVWEIYLTLLLVAGFFGWLGFICGQVDAESHHTYTPHFSNQTCVQLDQSIFCRK
jgi:uncharacterized membrane protein YsdA (DUF1294 family)